MKKDVMCVFVKWLEVIGGQPVSLVIRLQNMEKRRVKNAECLELKI